ncbi:short-subunit dehydrogenase [Stella humosa]|uniref:Short-subunit dehydrogenase n=1 Tax=Stella humosa TaxID=94 RepID=A0A3N1KPG8_9PROT|nr:SDR family NAD(P)-dependent oxidoreductase [Stella humosa]ROP83643.1 short-subunit dehydrogenase [Stella humosa]BBK33084.1 oxidoreductase [Stella humosa]
MTPGGGRLAWITGASSGIGAALAHELAAAGWRVAASARRMEGDGTHPAIRAFPLDITDADACAATVARIEAELGPIDLAVLNAGTHDEMPASAFDAARFTRLVEVNLLGTVRSLAPVMAAMVARRRGHIAIVASVAGYSGLPTAAAYGATKAALINMAEALKPELDAAGVRLQLVSPGFVRTPLTDRNTFPMPFLMPVDRAARRLRQGLESSRFEIVFPRRLAWLLKLMRILPYRLYFPLVRRITGKGGG